VAVKTQAPAPHLFTPKADSAEAEKVNKDYEGAKQTFEQKVNSPKAERALEKDTGMTKNEHLQKLQNDHVNSINKMNDAEKSKRDAQAEAQNDPYAAEVAGDAMNGKGNGGSDDNLIKNITSNFGGKAPGMVGGQNPMSAIRKPDAMNSRIQQQGGAGGGGFNRKVGGAVGNTNDPNALMGALQQKQGDAADMRAQMEGLGGQQDGLLGIGQKQAGAAQRFGGLKDAFSNKAQMHGDMQKAFGDAGKGLKKASKGLGNAAQVLNGVSQALQGAAAAVAPIPFVGPPLSKALGTASKIVGMVGKMLQAAGKKTGESGDKMNARSGEEGQKKEVNTAKKVENQAKETQAKDNVKRTQAKLDGVNGSKNEAQDALKTNAQEQKDLARKIQDNGGGKVAVDQAENGANDRPQIKLADKNRNQKGAKSSGTPASSAPASSAPASSAPASKAPASSAPASSPAGSKGAGSATPVAPAAGKSAAPAGPVAPPASSAPVASPQAPQASQPPKVQAPQASQPAKVQAPQVSQPAEQAPQVSQPAKQAPQASQPAKVQAPQASQSAEQAPQASQPAKVQAPQTSQSAEQAPQASQQAEQAPQASEPTKVQAPQASQPAKAQDSQPEQNGTSGRPASKTSKSAQDKQNPSSGISGIKKMAARKNQKNEQARKPRELTQAGQETVGGGDARRQRYETEMMQLADKVKGAQSGAQAHGRRDAQRQLANIYKDAAANNVAVSAAVEKKASEALKDSPERLGVKLRTVEEMGEGGALGGGARNNPFSVKKLGENKNNLQRAGLQVPRLAAPNFLAMVGAGQGKAEHQGVKEVAPISEKMAS